MTAPFKVKQWNGEYEYLGPSGDPVWPHKVRARWVDCGALTNIWSTFNTDDKWFKIRDIPIPTND